MIVALMVATAAAFFMYWSQHLTYKAMDLEDAGQRIDILKNATRFWPFNDNAQYELGKAYFDFGFQNLEDAAAGKDNIQKSVRSHVRSLRLNPANYYGHYNHAQSLFYMDHLMPSSDIDFMKEYKKAALLTGHNNEIYYEVGKIFLSQWDTLSEEDREFTVGILKKVTGRGNQELFQSLLHTWELNVGDYAVMGQILPDNSQILRTYAKFLGGKSLDQEERHRVLARAEHLDFENAKLEFEAGENEFRYFRIKLAVPHYRACLDLLKRIKLYQEITDTSQIDLAEFIGFHMRANFRLVRCGIQAGENLIDVREYLEAYLEMVERVADASELENYLVESTLLGSTLEHSASKPWLLNFHTLLYFKQNKYRDIKNIGNMMQKSFVMVPEEEKLDYLTVMQRVAESHLITGNFYDGLEYYEKALALDEYNVASLLGLRKNYDRLNEESEVRRLDQRLEGLLSPRTMDLGNSTIAKGELFVKPLILDGNQVNLSLEFADIEEGSQIFPLVSVILNGRVVWEDYLSGEAVSVSVETREVENRLEIMPINRLVTLKRIVWQ